jgi:hypothetical protein
MARKTTTVLFALLIAAAGAGAQTLTLNEMNSLKGLSALYVSILNEDGGSKVLDGAIRTETELRMRQAGIQVTGRYDWTRFVIQFEDHRGIDFYLLEPAILDRGSTRAWVVTWTLTGRGISTRQIVHDAVSEFLNQWLRDNPPPKLQTQKPSP